MDFVENLEIIEYNNKQQTNNKSQKKIENMSLFGYHENETNSSLNSQTLLFFFFIIYK